MPSLIEGNDRQTVKRTVPKQSNKIHAAGVAKLYVAYPNRQRWVFTGLQGAAVLANDLVGNTYWIKLVDLSPSNRGVIWDQEIYDTFQYNQDRVFFHSFEIDGTMAGLSFADDKEAKKFKQKMDEREKNAHKNTRSRPFSNAPGQAANGTAVNGHKSHSRLGGFGSLLHSHRNSSAPSQAAAQSIIPPNDMSVQPMQNGTKDAGLGAIDPELLDELLAMGITEDQLEQNAEFIRSWIAEKQAAATQVNGQKSKTPGNASPISPQHSGSGGSKRGPAPAPPQPRRGGRPDALERQGTSGSARESSPAAGGAKRWNFKAPPPFEGAGKFAEDAKAPPAPPSRGRGPSNAAQSGPPPPPRPAKTPLEDGESTAPRFGVPPPPPVRGSAPSLPSRGSAAPPPPPPREHSTQYTAQHAVPPAAVSPPPLPPKVPHNDSTPSTHAPHLPAREPQKPIPPPLPPSRDHHTPAQLSPPAIPKRDPHPVPSSPDDDDDEYDPYRYDSKPSASTIKATPVPPPPPPPARDAHVPPPPPSRISHSRDTSREVPPIPSVSHSRQPSIEPPPPPRPSSHSPQPHMAPPPPPPLPNATKSPSPPPLPKITEPPPPPPMPAQSHPPPPPPLPTSGGPPPPPPMPSRSGPPPPPAMPPGKPDADLEPATANAPALPPSEGGRDNLMASIRGGAKLKKVSDTEKNDRSAAAVPGGDVGSSAPGASSAPSGAGDQGGLAGALASALAARKSKVSASDDEDDKDDW